LALTVVFSGITRPPRETATLSLLMKMQLVTELSAIAATVIKLSGSEYRPDFHIIKEEEQFQVAHAAANG